VALDFSAKILITNPTTYHLGRGIAFFGLVGMAVGAISYFTGDFLMPALGWVAVATPPLVIGAILIVCGLTKP
jgi:hypothetical protein